MNPRAEPSLPARRAGRPRRQLPHHARGPLRLGDPQRPPGRRRSQLLNTGHWGIPFREAGRIGRGWRPQKGPVALPGERGGKAGFCLQVRQALNTILSLPPLALEKPSMAPSPVWRAPRNRRSSCSSTPPYNVLPLALVVVPPLPPFRRRRAALFLDPRGPRPLLFLRHLPLALPPGPDDGDIPGVISFTGFLEAVASGISRAASPTAADSSEAWLGCRALAFLKFSYLLLLFPPFSIHLWFAPKPRRRRESCVFPGDPALFYPASRPLGAVHHARFGGSFETGYGQWMAAGAPHDRFSWAGVPSGFFGYLFSPSRGIFLHFPVLVAAAGGFPIFRRKYPREALFLAGVFLLFLVSHAGLSNWAGESCYGPRYLLFLLPGLCLPAVDAPSAVGFRGADQPHVLQPVLGARVFAPLALLACLRQSSRSTSTTSPSFSSIGSQGRFGVTGDP